MFSSKRSNCCCLPGDPRCVFHSDGHVTDLQLQLCVGVPVIRLVMLLTGLRIVALFRIAHIRDACTLQRHTLKPVRPSFICSWPIGLSSCCRVTRASSSLDVFEGVWSPREPEKPQGALRCAGRCQLPRRRRLILVQRHGYEVARARQEKFHQIVGDLAHIPRILCHEQPGAASSSTDL